MHNIYKVIVNATIYFFLIFQVEAVANDVFDVQFDFYCGCPFTYRYDGGIKIAIVDNSSCAFVSRTGNSITIEKEHIVPVSVFAKGLECWEKPVCKKLGGGLYRGRKCCLKTDARFREIYYDMNNIRLVIGELNKARSNYTFGKVINGDNYGGCYISIDKANKIVEASEKIRPEIIAIYEYMRLKYSLDISIPK